MLLTLETKICRNQKIMHSRIDDEVVMMSADMKEYLAMNPTGTAIWGLLEQPVTLGGLIGQLVEQFDIDRETCEKETIEYISNLLKNNLVEIM